ncbi:MAG: CHRD domain-containing protein [Gemmatimonadaceae bacterium]
MNDVSWRARSRPGVLISMAMTVCGLLTGCGSEGALAAGNATYVAALTGAREVPGVQTAATGTATFNRTGTSVTYTVSASGFATPLTVAHVHIGSAGVIGSVIVPFTILAQSGTVATGSIDLSRPITQGNITISGDSLRTLFDNGTAYVNLHTAAFPGGEIRGQIVRQ